MLVLSRKKNESLIIADNIEIIIIGIRGNQVQLGISAPKNISVHRKEIYLTIKGLKDKTCDLINNGH